MGELRMSVEREGLKLTITWFNLRKETYPEG